MKTKEETIAKQVRYQGRKDQKQVYRHLQVIRRLAELHRARKEKEDSEIYYACPMIQTGFGNPFARIRS